MVKVFAALLLSVNIAVAQSDGWYAKAVKSVEATIEPAIAKPGQTVVYKITVELHDGYHTYPTVQADKKAEYQVNAIAFAETSALIYVGKLKEPEKPDIRPEPVLGIKELRTYHGTVVYERTAVVSPRILPGDFTISLKSFDLSVCDANSCYGPKKLTPSAKLMVKGDAVPVEKEWVAELEKALAGK